MSDVMSMFSDFMQETMDNNAAGIILTDQNIRTRL